jgi:hypothetical protein
MQTQFGFVELMHFNGIGINWRVLLKCTLKHRMEGKPVFICLMAGTNCGPL